MARGKHIKRIDPRYFLHETTNRVERRELKEECPHEEPGEEIDISGPGTELHVDDIGDLPPDEAFAAGLAVARDTIDQLLGDSEEDVDEEEIIALAEWLLQEARRSSGQRKANPNYKPPPPQPTPSGEVVRQRVNVQEPSPKRPPAQDLKPDPRSRDVVRGQEGRNLKTGRYDANNPPPGEKGYRGKDPEGHKRAQAAKKATKAAARGKAGKSVAKKIAKQAFKAALRGTGLVGLALTAQNKRKQMQPGIDKISKAMDRKKKNEELKRYLKAIVLEELQQMSEGK